MAFSSSGSNIVPFLRQTELFLRRQLQQATTGESSQSQTQGRTVLTVLYICVLGLCILVPIVYYVRLHCFEEHARRELEFDFTAALEQSEHFREESRAARRKYIDERSARIIQLMAPVRLVLKQENFPHLSDPEHAGTVIQQHQYPRSGSLLNLDFDSEKYKIGKSDESATLASEDVLSPCTSDDEASAQGCNNKGLHTKSKHDDDNSTLEQGLVETKSEYEDDDNKESNPYDDEAALMVRIPVPGMPMGGSCFLDLTRTRQQQQDNGGREMRLAPGLCTICLCNYKVGSDIVWSSNEACDHHFHANCIEKWLMKQREGPLCPICRRDFIVDPLDLLEEDKENVNANSQERVQVPMLLWDQADDAFDGAVQQRLDNSVVTTPGYLLNNNNDITNPSQLEEGMHAPSCSENNEVNNSRGSSNSSSNNNHSDPLRSPASE